MMTCLVRAVCGAMLLAVLSWDSFAWAISFFPEKKPDNDICEHRGCGTVFKIEPDGTETVLHSFAGPPTDGARPGTGLAIDRAGNLYGTAWQSGTKGCFSSGFGCGIVFKLSPDGSEKILYVFNSDSGPLHASHLLLDPDGNILGTTSEGGGSNACQRGCGTVFKLAPDGKLSVVLALSGLDGAQPTGLTMDAAGALYVSTATGGGNECDGVGCGTLVKISGDGRTTMLHKFRGEGDGMVPEGKLFIDKAGNLFGSTPFGGKLDECHSLRSRGCGTVFKVSPDGIFTVLHAFSVDSDNVAMPMGELVVDSTGTLYGASGHGGPQDWTKRGDGSVFKVSLDGKVSTIYAFTGGQDGRVPGNGLIMDAAGNLYGTTGIGGNVQCDPSRCSAKYAKIGYGVVFKITPDGRETVLHAFGVGKDGAQPGGLVMDAKGNLYGTTEYGGTFDNELPNTG